MENKIKYGPLQSEILDVLSCDYDGSYWYSMYDLVEITKKHQQSIHRALKKTPI